VSSQSQVFERATRRLFTRIMASLAAALTDEELTVAQLTTLHLIDDRGSLYASELADALHRSPSTVSRMVEALVQRSWVMRTEDAADRRIKRLALTPEGQRVIQRLGDARVTVIRDHLERHAPRLLVAGLLKAMERSLAKDLAKEKH
jgi:DNA-binding MarR family transcriptional regulator